MKALRCEADVPYETVEEAEAYPRTASAAYNQHIGVDRGH
jgi:hypothetical protein